MWVGGGVQGRQNMVLPKTPILVTPALIIIYLKEYLHAKHNNINIIIV
jgi:hypothetical protein